MGIFLPHLLKPFTIHVVFGQNVAARFNPCKKGKKKTNVIISPNIARCGQKLARSVSDCQKLVLVQQNSIHDNRKWANHSRQRSVHHNCSLHNIESCVYISCHRFPLGKSLHPICSSIPLWDATIWHLQWQYNSPIAKPVDLHCMLVRLSAGHLSPSNQQY